MEVPQLRFPPPPRVLTTFENWLILPFLIYVIEIHSHTQGESHTSILLLNKYCLLANSKPFPNLLVMDFL